ncbi:WD40 repeat-like protein [Macrolepiota fuliginosa MF-IS2]|uniref:WD40 repeat-like protein n=1 Tax=Macrolepiota fuliginosa MF-IS2 TaxID=1400762 RepID=A0A9P5XFU4_9AGAR|nr:WD40 repeat-like protein [Macrolepiota fuliginosa MF-IS2]
MYQLLSSMPRSQLSSLQRRIAPLLQFDVVGSLPTEVALQIFSNLPPHSLLTCAIVSRRWNVLANDQSLWKALCATQNWEWRQPVRPSGLDAESSRKGGVLGIGNDDEGMGGSDDEDTKAEESFMTSELDSGFASLSMIRVPSQSSSRSAPGSSSVSRSKSRDTAYLPPVQRSKSAQSRYSAPPTLDPSPILKPNYKLLYRTHIHILNRFLTSHYRLSVIQTRGTPANGHMNMIYCVQLYTYPSTNRQVIFTGSRDKTIREWNLKTGEVERVLEGVHTESVLSLCVRKGRLASAGSDRRVVVWDLEAQPGNEVVKVLRDHVDSVLCVRFDDERLVSCSKDRTVRVYSFPGLELQHVFGGHRAAVNAVSLSPEFVVSGSGDRSMNVWDVKTGKLVQTFEDHHTRGIASIDFKPPCIVSGSSDKHIRLVDMNTSQGWSTSPEYDTAPLGHGHGLGNTNNAPLAHMNHLPHLLPSVHQHHIVDSAVGYTTCMCQSCGSVMSIPPTPTYTSPAISNVSSMDGGTGSDSSGRLSYMSHHPHVGYPAHLLHSYNLRRATQLPYQQQIQGVQQQQQQQQQQNQNHPQAHADLVRSVTLTPDFVISGSYDLSVKVWLRHSGAQVADLTGGHTGKIFCVAADRTRVVSCGEDLRICVWDFGVGVRGVEEGWVKGEL